MDGRMETTKKEQMARMPCGAVSSDAWIHRGTWNETGNDTDESQQRDTEMKSGKTRISAESHSVGEMPRVNRDTEAGR